MICMRCWWENNPQISKPSSKCPKKTLSSPIFPRENPWKKKSFFHIFPWKIPRFSDVFSPMWRMRPAPQPTSASASGGRTPAGPGGRRAPGRAHRAGRRPCQAPLRGLRAPETDLAAQGGPQPGGKGLDLWKKGRILWEKVGIIWGSGDIYIYRERERLEYELFKNVYTCQIDDDSCIWKGISSIDSNGRYINKDWRMRMMADG